MNAPPTPDNSANFGPVYRGIKDIGVDAGIIHFIGIGGIGMSGIAEVLQTMGYQVQGSDMDENANIVRLRAMGITIIGHHAAHNVHGVGVVVISSAIKIDNPELQEARSRRIPIVRRAEMLGEIMRMRRGIAIGGTHGKTTITSLMASLFDHAGMDPTVINGGIINAWSSNARLGKSDWMIAEADESDGSFLKLPACIVLVSNIDQEHMEYYGNFSALHGAFLSFVENIPFYGFAVLCVDDPEVQSLINGVTDRKIISYGHSIRADVHSRNIRSIPEGVVFDVNAHVLNDDKGVQMRDVFLPMYGEHNVQNALGVIATALKLGLTPDVVKKALGCFQGVGRRFTKTGHVGGTMIIDDYAHHPVEITAVMKAARAVATGKVIAVFQPHRYSRLQDLFDGFCSCFHDADTVIVTDVYGANETPIDGVDAHALVAGLHARSHRDARYIPSPAVPQQPEEMAFKMQEFIQEGNLIICLGAGSCTHWAHALPRYFERHIDGKERKHD